MDIVENIAHNLLRYETMFCHPSFGMGIPFFSCSLWEFYPQVTEIRDKFVLFVLQVLRICTSFFQLAAEVETCSSSRKNKLPSLDWNQGSVLWFQFPGFLFYRFMWLVWDSERVTWGGAREMISLPTNIVHQALSSKSQNLHSFYDTCGEEGTCVNIGKNIHFVLLLA